MNLKKEYNSLVESIKKEMKLRGESARNEDIANMLGYNRSYFSSLLGTGAKVTQNHIDVLKMYSKEMLANPTSTAGSKGAKAPVVQVKKFSGDLDEIISRQQERLMLLEAAVEVFGEKFAEMHRDSKGGAISKFLTDLENEIKDRYRMRFDEWNQKP
jgi:hypothetical protein